MSSEAAATRPRANRSLRAEGSTPAPAPRSAKSAPPGMKSVAPGVKSAAPGAKSVAPGARSSLPEVDPGEIPVETCEPVTGRRKKARARVGARQKLAALGVKLRAFASVASAIGVLALAGIGGREGHRWLVTTDRFNAREVIVTGAEHTSRAEVMRAAGISPERNVLSIDCEAAAKAIEGLPWVSRARVTRRLPGHVEVSVEERSAVALVSAGGMYLVGADGTLFKRAVPSDPSDLPVVTGIDRESFERDPAGAREAVRDALALLADVEASAVGAPLRIDEVHCEPTGDLSIVVGGAHVWLGRGPYRAKLTRLRVVMRELERRALRPSEIHLESDRHPERVTVRMASR